MNKPSPKPPVSCASSTQPQEDVKPQISALVSQGTQPTVTQAQPTPSSTSQALSIPGSSVRYPFKKGRFVNLSSFAKESLCW
jgi:hypothetical protein